MAPGIRLIGGNMCRGERAGSGGGKRKAEGEETIRCREECENVRPLKSEDRSAFPEMWAEE